MVKDRERRIGKWGHEGVTVTFIHRTTGATHTVVSPGIRKAEALADACLGVDPVLWRIGTVSTPQTIYDDLSHARKLREKPEFGGHDRRGAILGRDLSAHIGGVRHPEQFMAAQAGVREWL